ncbi:glycosyltransferase family 2 protein [Sinorhizobium sp. BG8]|uniref:glycosyltransferase family 2 protein n=1 Tax=Sinorhizobium sp. BG8 TaxID=2613773 RepID=UPI00193E18AC|nr:glycosyltransferase family 2 protein [Sinorhizobium sp. BG8]QRM55844.1 glycosyltransferase [Sinorhizobium sp. BG8]
MIEVAVVWLVILCSAALSVPIAVYAIECLAGSLPSRRERVPDRRIRPAIAVLVPAHDEEAGISETLANIRSQLAVGDRLVVVADNCRDQTAALARAAGAEVVERRDEERRGKGYALDTGIRHLAEAPPAIVLIVDADCQFGPGAIDHLAGAAAATGRPIQARNLMLAPKGAGLNLSVAEFAFLVKNHVRPLGLYRLGLPCQVTGTGTAFPWEVLGHAKLANANIVEDVKMGLELAYAGHPPQFCEKALVTSFFPYSNEGAETQRRRWENGHLALIRSALRSLFYPKTYRGVNYLAMTLDIIVPPLTLLAGVAVAMLLVSGAISLAGLGATAFWISMANVALLLAATFIAWAVHGRVALPARTLVGVPAYILAKFARYPRALLHRSNDGWVRTDRTRPEES